MEYTVTEFRKNIREILDAIDHGADVKIKRYNAVYGLYIERGTFIVDKKSTSAVLPGEKAPEKVFTKEVTAASKGSVRKVRPSDVVVTPKNTDVAICPHGAGVGMCRIDSCNRKYAK